MKRVLYLGVILAVVLLGQVAYVSFSARAELTTETNLNLLFVQNANDVQFKDGKMTLKGVHPNMIFFSDRPERVAGQMSTKDIVTLWTKTGDSFKKNPPNATLSFMEGEKIESVVVELSNPQMEGNDLTYDIRILEGTVLKSGRACSLFIDIIGMPLTPGSYAGAARRGARYGAFYGVPVAYYPAPVYVAPAPVVVQRQVVVY